MATARVIHFGIDYCYRAAVLRRVGYEVDESDSLDRLRLDLEGDENVDAVIVSGVEPPCAEQVAVLVRQRSRAPLILFRRPGVALDESRFDRVYDSVVPTAYWLSETALLVMQSKELLRSLRTSAARSGSGAGGEQTSAGLGRGRAAAQC